MIEIWDDIANGDQISADKIVRVIGERINSLNEMPQRGKPRDDLFPGSRMLVERKYLIFYRVKNNKVEVLRVIHGSRDLTSIFS